MKSFCVTLVLFLTCGLLADCGSVSNKEMLEVSRKLYMDDAGDRIVNYSINTTQNAQKFFIKVNEKKFQHFVYSNFFPLLENYNRETGIYETMNYEKEEKIIRFLNTFINSKVGSRLYNFLQPKGIPGCSNKAEFKRTLKTKWFDLYRRSRKVLDSSGFEHVFVGEINSYTGKTIGFHNWVQYYSQQKAGNIKYLTHLEQCLENLHSLEFEWHNALKPCSGFAMGVSPAYDLAVFTLCHIAKPGKRCKVSYRNTDGNFKTAFVQTYTWRYTPHIASAYFLC
ncbi:uridylate-specific endoribonuclease A-like isoform X1 [Clavelina lepadiformis]|uniref:uridylate-specific endoribonuclease A-like isoform X1 n=1 Tax=Clavelina lepadiformis TaxID=159417 RepID=UPI004042EA61